MEEYNLDDPFLDEFFEFRLFYVRISQCEVSWSPDRLTLRCFIQKPYEFLEINGTRVLPTAPFFPVTLSWERLNGDPSQLVYTSTDRIRMNAHGMWFEIVDYESVIARGNIGKWKCDWTTTDTGLDTDMRTGYSVMLNVLENLNNGMPGASVPSVEVYVAGCCSGVPVAVTATGHPQ